MRLHKTNTLEYIPFYKSLEDLSDEDYSSRAVLSIIKNTPSSTANLLEKYSHAVQILVNFEKRVEVINGINLLTNELELGLKRIFPVKKSALLIFDNIFHSLKFFGERGDKKVLQAMNNYYHEGIFNILFESHEITVLPELESYNSKGTNLNYVLFPLFDGKKKRGLYSLLTTLPKEKISELDKKFAKMMLNIVMAKIDKTYLKNKLNSTYEELQTYQAKLSNDFRLSAIGEMTEGIIEGIMTPLQVIMSNIDLIELSGGFNGERENIKTQIKKINNVINRLVKFSNINQKNVQIAPFQLNDVIQEYFNLVHSTLESVNIECVLDLEKGVPSILTHPNYIYQLLTNIFGLIKSGINGNGGVIIQTRFKNGYIYLKIVTSAKLQPYSDKLNSINKSSDLNIRIINNLMKKHEGSFIVESFENSGSAIALKFPLKRKIRK